jgi:16S rRNA (guanine(527)-N(7))-methyltransferase RsmG
MIDDLKEMGAELDNEQLDLFGEFAGILLERSARTNLIGPLERNRLWARHFLESVSYSQMLDRSRTVVDIGSGNGFPGIVLAIMGFRMILLEPRRKRYLFLDHAIRELRLDNCVTVSQRLEDFRPELDVFQFVARSVAPPVFLLDKIEAVSGKDSVLVYRQPEISGKRFIENFIELRCPPLDRGGFLVQYRV